MTSPTPPDAQVGLPSEEDESSRYVRKVVASDPHFNVNRAAAFALYGFQQWKRAKAANQRADTEQAARKGLSERLRSDVLIEALPVETLIAITMAMTAGAADPRVIRTQAERYKGLRPARDPDK